jgi:hypothetical protein
MRRIRGIAISSACGSPVRADARAGVTAIAAATPPKKTHLVHMIGGFRPAVARP